MIMKLRQIGDKKMFKLAQRLFFTGDNHHYPSRTLNKKWIIVIDKRPIIVLVKRERERVREKKEREYFRRGKLGMKMV